MGPAALAQVLRPLAGMFDAAEHPDLLQGLATPDDAAVWRLDGERALVLTSDFFSPVVDDAYEFGAIAAANALSDVYAMGARPLLAINLVAFPGTLDAAILGEILRGGAEKVREAGAVVAGGHSVDDKEPKYGLAVVGMVHPDRILKKGGARPGDALYLSKPIGTGVVTTALKRDSVDASDLAVASAGMMRLHADVVRRIEALPGAVGAATDVTGFSLAGHAREMAAQSGLTLRIEWSRVPLLPGAARYARAGCSPGGTHRNREHFSPFVQGTGSLEDWQLSLLFDPQTSGGLLLAVRPEREAELVDAFAGAADAPVRIGEAVAGDAGIIEIV